MFSLHNPLHPVHMMKIWKGVKYVEQGDFLQANHTSDSRIRMHTHKQQYKSNIHPITKIPCLIHRQHSLFAIEILTKTHKEYNIILCCDHFNQGSWSGWFGDSPIHALHAHLTLLRIHLHALPHKVKTQYLHFRSHPGYFLLSWKTPEEIIAEDQSSFHN